MASDDATGRRRLAGLGEFAVIDRLVARIASSRAVVALGPGDDAAVVLAPDGRTVVSTDMLVEGRHFRLDWSTPHDVGRKAIAAERGRHRGDGCGGDRLRRRASARPATRRATTCSRSSDGMWDEARRFGGGHRRRRPRRGPAVGDLGDGAG